MPYLPNIQRFAKNNYFSKTYPIFILDAGVCKTSINKLFRKEASRLIPEAKLRTKHLGMQKIDMGEASVTYCIISARELTIVNGQFAIGVHIYLDDIKIIDSKNKLNSKDLFISFSKLHTNFDIDSEIREMKLNGSKIFIDKLIYSINALKEIQDAELNAEITSLQVIASSNVLTYLGNVVCNYWIDTLKGELLFALPSHVAISAMTNHNTHLAGSGYSCKPSGICDDIENFKSAGLKISNYLLSKPISQDGGEFLKNINEESIKNSPLVDLSSIGLRISTLKGKSDGDIETNNHLIKGSFMDVEGKIWTK
ncbi:MAG: hypothetical protein VX335_00080 [Pseudomonadota bacterium]|nr:hypothetical protein [Pseudomonadota bacterium]